MSLETIRLQSRILSVSATHLELKSRQRTLVSCFNSNRGNGLLINIFMIWQKNYNSYNKLSKSHHLKSAYLLMSKS